MGSFKLKISLVLFLSRLSRRCFSSKTQDLQPEACTQSHDLCPQAAQRQPGGSSPRARGAVAACGQCPAVVPSARGRQTLPAPSLLPGREQGRETDPAGTDGGHEGWRLAPRLHTCNRFLATIIRITSLVPAAKDRLETVWFCPQRGQKKSFADALSTAQKCSFQVEQLRWVLEVLGQNLVSAQGRVQRDSCWCFFYLGTERMRAPGTEQSQSYVSSSVLHFTTCSIHNIQKDCRAI